MKPNEKHISTVKFHKGYTLNKKYMKMHYVIIKLTVDINQFVVITFKTNHDRQMLYSNTNCIHVLTNNSFL
jgi:hypothetical protein